MDVELFPLEMLLTPRDVADWLGVSIDWVQDHATSKEPRIPCLRMGRLLRFRREAVESFIPARTQKPLPACSRSLEPNGRPTFHRKAIP